MGLMSEDKALTQRMEDLKRRIDQAEEKLRLRMILHKDHQVTIDELRRRYALIEQQLEDETATLEAKGHHVDSFEKMVMRWIDTLTFDH